MCGDKIKSVYNKLEAGGPCVHFSMYNLLQEMYQKGNVGPSDLRALHGTRYALLTAFCSLSFSLSLV